MVTSIFKNITAVLTYTGVRIDKSRNLILNCFIGIYLLVIFLLMCVYSCVSIWLSVLGNPWDKLASNMWQVMSIIQFGFLIKWQLKDIFTIHMKLIEQATSISGCLKYKKQLKMCSNFSFLAAITFVLFFTGQSIYFILPFGDIHLQIGDFQPSVAYYLFVRPYGKFLYCFSFFYMALAIGTTTFIFVTACVIDTVEFLYLNKQLKEEKQLTTDKLKSHFLKHTKLVTAVDQLDDTFSCYIFLQMCGAIPIIIIYVYRIVTDAQSFSLQLIPSLISQCTTVIVFTFGPAMINWVVSINSCFAVVVQFTIFFCRLL